MRYQLKLDHAEVPGGYSGAQMGSGRNSGEQERESWKDDNSKTAFDGNRQVLRNDSDGNSNIGSSNEFNTDASRADSNRRVNDANDLRSQLDNSI